MGIVYWIEMIVRWLGRRIGNGLAIQLGEFLVRVNEHSCWHSEEIGRFWIY